MARREVCPRLYRAELTRNGCETSGFRLQLSKQRFVHLYLFGRNAYDALILPNGDTHARLLVVSKGAQRADAHAQVYAPVQVVKSLVGHVFNPQIRSQGSGARTIVVPSADPRATNDGGNRSE